MGHNDKLKNNDRYNTAMKFSFKIYKKMWNEERNREISQRTCSLVLYVVLFIKQKPIIVQSSEFNFLSKTSLPT